MRVSYVLIAEYFDLPYHSQQVLIVQQHQIINDLIIPNFLHFVLENQ
jgi:hypothetical protein